jgi:NDMA-dependent alcohol dehydrogenase
MKTRAAIIRQPPCKYEIETVELDEPRAGEILVKMAASGLCHSDDHLATGDMPMATYPLCGGHEGGGVVVEVGQGVKSLAEGDHVVFSFLPGCGRCRWCASGLQNLCDLGANLGFGSRLDDPTSFRMHLDGQPVGQMSGLGTFSNYTTVDVNSAVKIPSYVPLDKACLLGCGVATGWGSAVNSAEVQVGDTVIVMGVGGIGINAVQGAAHAGASHIVAVDPVAFKRQKAIELGATHAFDNMREATEFARSVTNGQGADSAIVAVGVTTAAHVTKAYWAIRKAGTVVVTGIGNSNELGPKIPLMDLVLNQKRIQGSLFGSCAPSKDIPRLLQLYLDGKLKLDELVTATYTLDQVNEGYADMHDGRLIRGVITYDS